MGIKRKTLLITGVSGLVGGHVLARAAKQYSVTATCHDHPFAWPGVRVRRLDLESADNIRRCMEETRPRAVIHCAAWSGLDACEQDPDRCFRVNAEAPGVLAQSCEAVGSRLVFVSTDMVFDGENAPYDETDETNPVNVYGRAKVEAEKRVLSACRNAVAARSALVYGPSVTGGRSFSEWILERLGKGEEVPLFTDQYRTPVPVQDLAAALLELADHFCTGILHLAGPQRIDRYAFGEALARARGLDAGLLRPVSMKDVQYAAPRPVDASLNTKRAVSILHTRFSNIQEGVQKN
ncbi:MAG TPA: SDR family oxidoreductase [bacterium]|nr:SDR family oxidoreductase [bacterium]